MPSPWKCSTCSKTFVRKGDLTRHMNLHTGHKPHVCEYCDKAFAQYSGLKTHRNVHTKERPFGCGQCPARFGDPSSRARHRRETHLNPGGYRCPYPKCSTRIKRRSCFAKHLRQKHGVAISDSRLEEALIQNDEYQTPLPINATPSPSPGIDDDPNMHLASQLSADETTRAYGSLIGLDIPFMPHQASLPFFESPYMAHETMGPMDTTSPMNYNLLLDPQTGPASQSLTINTLEYSEPHFNQLPHIPFGIDCQQCSSPAPLTPEIKVSGLMPDDNNYIPYPNYPPTETWKDFAMDSQTMSFMPA